MWYDISFINILAKNKIKLSTLYQYQWSRIHQSFLTKKYSNKKKKRKDEIVHFG